MYSSTAVYSGLQSTVLQRSTVYMVYNTPLELGGIGGVAAEVVHDITR